MTSLKCYCDGRGHRHRLVWDFTVVWNGLLLGVVAWLWVCAL